MIHGRIGIGNLDKVGALVEFDFGDFAVYLSNIFYARALQLINRVVRIGSIRLSGGIRVRVIRLLLVGSALIGSRIALKRIALR